MKFKKNLKEAYENWNLRKIMDKCERCGSERVENEFFEYFKDCPKCSYKMERPLNEWNRLYKV